NVGIGTTAPSTALEANGVIRSTRLATPGQYIEINGGDAGAVSLTVNSVTSKPFNISNNLGDIRLLPSTSSVQINDNGMSTLADLHVVKGFSTNYLAL